MVSQFVLRAPARIAPLPGQNPDLSRGPRDATAIVATRTLRDGDFRDNIIVII
jgi:hypothetical protein